MSILEIDPFSNRLIGPIPVLATLMAITILLGRIRSQVKGRKLSPLSFSRALCLSQGIAGLVAMVVALSLFEIEIRSNLTVKEFAMFLAAFTSLGAATTLLPNVILRNVIFWPHLFQGAEKKALSRTRIGNISFSVGTLAIMYGCLALIYLLGPERFVDKPFYRAKSRLFILLFGSPDNVLTWSWVAAALLGFLVAGAVYILLFEIIWRKDMEH